MRTKLKKIRVTIGVILLAILVLGLMIRATGNFTTGRQLEKQLESLRSQGFPLNHRDFEPKCQDQENAALIWKGAEAMFVLEKDEWGLVNKTLENLFYDRAIDSSSREKLKDLITRNQNSLRLIKEATAKPCFKYIDDWDCPPWELQLPNAIKIIQALRLFGIEAVLKAEDGHVTEGLEQCLQGIRFARRYLDEPFLINYLISMSNMQMYTTFINKILSGRALDPETLSLKIKEFDINFWRTALENSLRSELTYSIAIGMSLLSGKSPEQELGFWQKKSLWLFRPLVKRDIRTLLLSWQKTLSMPLFPYYATGETREMVENYSNNFKSSQVIRGYIFPNLTATLFKQGRLEAKLLTAQIGIAAKIFHSWEGRYPEKISDLVPDILEKEPLDPFTSKSFVYRQQENGFIVYSLGSNLKDDNGRDLYQPTRLIADKDDDITWLEKALKK